MSPSRSDFAFLCLLVAAAGTSGGIVLLISAFLIIESLPALSSLSWHRFFSDPRWHPVGGAGAGSFNMLPMLIGTAAAALGAIILAAPLGVASALFAAFYAPAKIRTTYRRMVELLAGIPSVIYGFWGLVVLAPIIRQWQPPGQSLLAGVLILAIMVLPTVALLAEQSFSAVPKSYIEASAAIGLSRFAMIRGVILPAAWGGIFTAVLLAAGRAVGETMAVLMVAGNVVQIPKSAFDPIRTLTANIALELGYAMDHHRSALFVSGLMLMAMVLALVALASTLSEESLNV